MVVSGTTTNIHTATVTITIVDPTPQVKLAHPTFKHKVCGDGNCLFRAFSYLITGTEDQHFEVRCCIVEHLRSVGHRLLGNFIDEATVEEYISNWSIGQIGAWDTTVEMVVLAH